MSTCFVCSYFLGPRVIYTAEKKTYHRACLHNARPFHMHFPCLLKVHVFVILVTVFSLLKSCMLCPTSRRCSCFLCLPLCCLSPSLFNEALSNFMLPSWNNQHVIWQSTCSLSFSLYSFVWDEKMFNFRASGDNCTHQDVPYIYSKGIEFAGTLALLEGLYMSKEANLIRFYNLIGFSGLVFFDGVAVTF